MYKPIKWVALVFLNFITVCVFATVYEHLESIEKNLILCKVIEEDL